MRMHELLDQDGFVIVPEIVQPEDCDEFVARLEERLDNRPGTRSLLDEPWCLKVVETLKRHLTLSPLLPNDSRVVQCTLFDKSPAKNWLVAWHQDLSIPVRERTSDYRCRGWSLKEGKLYVQPPEEVLALLVIVRLQLDEETGDGALKVIPGSHKDGRLSDSSVKVLCQDKCEHLCVVPRGGVLVMRPLTLHASSKARNARRRVLQFLFGPPILPCGLTW